MKNRFKDYWYSLGDSTRAILRIASVFVLMGFVILSCFLWEIDLLIYLCALLLFVIGILAYLPFIWVKDSEEKRRYRYLERKQREEYFKRLQEQGYNILKNETKDCDKFADRLMGYKRIIDKNEKEI